MISNTVHRFPIDQKDLNLEACVEVKKSIRIWVEYKETTFSLAEKKVNDALLHLQNIIRDEVIKQKKFPGETLWVQSSNRQNLVLRGSVYGKVTPSKEQIQKNEYNAAQAMPLEMLGQSQRHVKTLKPVNSRDFLLTFESIKKILENISATGNLKNRSDQIKAKQLENTDVSLAKRSAKPERKFAEELKQAPKKSNFIARGLSQIWSVVSAIFKCLGRFFLYLLPKSKTSEPTKKNESSDSISYTSKTLIINKLDEVEDDESASEDEEGYATTKINSALDGLVDEKGSETEGHEDDNAEDYQTETFRNKDLAESYSSEA